MYMAETELALTAHARRLGKLERLHWQMQRQQEQLAQITVMLRDLHATVKRLESTSPRESGDDKPI